uniref:hypothetical protein n=1 Tax=Arhodomonas sp. AD133 TaxID=3415009 RepID=UPI003EBBA90F
SPDYPVIEPHESVCCGAAYRLVTDSGFYYVRVDNGVLAPFLAWFLINVLVGLEVAWYLIGTSIAIGLLTVIYIPRIYCEIEFFQRILAEQEQCQSNQSSNK